MLKMSVPVTWLLLIISTSIAGHIPEEELAKRRMVLERERPYPKITKYISCQVCQLATQSMHKVMLISMKDKAKRHLAEEDLNTLVTETCNPWSNIGVWITAMDIDKNKKDELELNNKETMGRCKRDCETVRAACEHVINEDNEPEEIAQFLYENQREMTEQKLLEYMCGDTCLRDGITPKVPKKLAKKTKIGKEEWEPMSKEEQQKRVDIFQEIMRQNTARKAEL